MQREALDFHGVNRELFRRAAIIPFRFPTALAEMAQIDAHLRERAVLYGSALAQFRDKVQMELRLSLAESKPCASAASGEDATTGTMYLKSRARSARQTEEAISACRVAINEEVIDWRQRESSHGVHCFALIRREAVTGFQQQIKCVRLDEAVTAAVSGPWPPTEFFPVFA